MRHDMILRGTELQCSPSHSSSADDSSEVSDCSSEDDHEAGLAAIEEHHESVRAAMPKVLRVMS